MDRYRYLPTFCVSFQVGTYSLVPFGLVIHTNILLTVLWIRIPKFLGHPHPSLVLWIRIRILLTSSKKVRKSNKQTNSQKTLIFCYIVKAAD